MALTKGPKPEMSAEVEATETESDDRQHRVVDEQEESGQMEMKLERDVAPVTNTPATTRPSGLAKTGNTAAAIKELAEAGFDDLSLGFGAFPMIALPGQMFESSEGHNLGTEFTCSIAQKASKTLYKGTDPDDDEVEEVVYSYDGSITTNGEELDEIVGGWKAKGYKIERKQYFDVVVQVLSGPMEGKIAIMSLPPTARTTFSGYLVGLKLQHGKLPGEVVTRVYVGQKVSKAVKPYYPWAFDCAGLLEE